MNRKEFCKQYDVSKEFIKQFFTAGILDVNVDAMYESETVNKLETCISLHSLGLDICMIKNYIFLEQSNKDTRKDLIYILQKCRRENLKNVHQIKKRMDCIDCILHEWKTNEV